MSDEIVLRNTKIALGRIGESVFGCRWRHTKDQKDIFLYHHVMDELFLYSFTVAASQQHILRLIYKSVNIYNKKKDIVGSYVNNSYPVLSFTRDHIKKKGR